MVFIDQRRVEGGLELADGAHLKVPIYNALEVVPVASEFYPVANANTKIETPANFSTSRISLETGSQKSQSSPLRESTLIRRKRRLWICCGIILLSAICITVGVLVARALQGKGGSDTSDRSVSSSKTYAASDIQTTPPTFSNTIFTPGTATKVPVSIIITTLPAITNLPAPTTRQTFASLSSSSTTSSNTFTSSISSASGTNSCQNPPIIKCSDSVCEGINAQSRIGGFCTAGVYSGCPCVSVCGGQPGPCSLNNCSGVNNICAGGIYRGCNCS